MNEKYYSLPDLPYEYDSLQPHISEKQLRIHHSKHHQGYVDKSNALLEKLEKARENDQDLDMKSTLKFFSFTVGGHILHSLFWENLSPDGGGSPGGLLADELGKEFGSFERFKKEFTKACAVEGSGWGALAYCTQTQRPVIMQIEKHNVNIYPMFQILMVLDLWEHAFYLDYQNEKNKFVDAFWNLVDWETVDDRMNELR